MVPAGISVSGSGKFLASLYRSPDSCHLKLVRRSFTLLRPEQVAVLEGCPPGMHSVHLQSFR